MNHQNEIDSFIDYVHKPIKIFENKAAEMKKLNIDTLFSRYCTTSSVIF
jgi:hypothetical protein